MIEHNCKNSVAQINVVLSAYIIMSTSTVLTDSHTSFKDLLIMHNFNIVNSDSFGLTILLRKCWTTLVGVLGHFHMSRFYVSQQKTMKDRKLSAAEHASNKNKKQ